MYVAMMLNSLIPCSSELKLRVCVWIASHQYCSHIHTYIYTIVLYIYKVSTVKKTSVIILYKAQQYICAQYYKINNHYNVTECFVNRCTHLCIIHNYNKVYTKLLYIPK